MIPNGWVRNFDTMSGPDGGPSITEANGSLSRGIGTFWYAWQKSAVAARISHSGLRSRKYADTAENASSDSGTDVSLAAAMAFTAEARRSPTIRTFRRPSPCCSKMAYLGAKHTAPANSAPSGTGSDSQTALTSFNDLSQLRVPNSVIRNRSVL